MLAGNAFHATGPVTENACSQCFILLSINYNK